MRRLGRLAAGLMLLGSLAAAAPAAAQRTPGWRFFRTGDMAISPMMPGVLVGVGDGGSLSVFSLNTDFDYHVRGGAAIGALFNMGFRGGGFLLQLGPQFKYKFQVGQTPHVPYVRAAIPITVGSGSLVWLGIPQFGGGYKYFFHRMVGAGIDINFAPTIVANPGSAFIFVVNINFGVEVKF